MNCNKCGKGIDPDAQFCGHCGAPRNGTAPRKIVSADLAASKPTYEQKKSPVGCLGIVIRVFVGGILFIFALGIISGLVGHKSPTAQVGGTQSSANAQVAQDGSIVTGTTRWKILKATNEGNLLKSTNMFKGDKQGNGTKYIMVVAGVENLDKKSKSTLVTSLKIIDDQGREFDEFSEQELYVPEGVDSYNSTPLNPGMHRKIAKIFEVPEGANNFKIKLYDLSDLFSLGGGAIVDLKLSAAHVSGSRHSARKTENTATDNGDGTVTLRRGEATDE